jgi:NAD(P)-dependent dehydrogenase (short-subunit alcohol dehydrogenase family)
MAQMVMDQSPGKKALWESENLLGRLAEPHEFAGAAVFLLGDASSFMTGSMIVMDGGHTAW